MSEKKTPRFPWNSPIPRRSNECISRFVFGMTHGRRGSGHEGLAQEGNGFPQRLRFEELGAAVRGAVYDEERDRQAGALIGPVKLVGLVNGHLGVLVSV